MGDMLTSPSGKSYVGQTTKTLKERFAQHRTAKTHTAIARAIAKYGADAFVVQELLRVDESLLDHYEQKFIDAFRTMAPHAEILHVEICVKLCPNTHWRRREGGGRRVGWAPRP